MTGTSPLDPPLSRLGQFDFFVWNMILTGEDYLIFFVEYDFSRLGQFDKNLIFCGKLF